MTPIRLPKYLLFTLTFLLLFSCKNDDKNTKSSKRKSDLEYAMLPLEDSLPRLSATYTTTKKRQIEGFFENNFGRGFENVSFLVAKNGQIIYEKYDGYADKENNILNSPETPLHIASVTKVLTAAAILKLIDAKKISLDQKLTTLFEGFPYPDVTIRTLLNHRSGMKKYNYFCDDKAIWGRDKTLTNTDLLNVIITKDIKLETKTDTHFSYNNTNYALLALIIEKVTKMKYAEAMKKIIFEPLDMKNTFVFDENTPKEKATPSYKYNYVKYPFDFLDAVYGDKNIYSTPRDLLKFDLARNSPDFISKKLADQVFKGYSYESRGEKNYGLGIRMREWETGQKLFYHNGWWHGNTSSYINLRKENTVIIALSNKFTRQTFQMKRLSALFGDYPFTLKDTTSKDE
ncbi:serine hydrolase [Flavobacterium sp.]|uniref:serine hydrolase domain-containing protein n=1 Tax=Flavobacterium sp. TaxID=239 RepID=UPI000ED8750D|nr:serine hydrolase domain-containing protein [Flavobacterium sp.]HCQ13154.1 penicillin-binding protein [Flavobacterium sp.]